jgi:hypothetical protein
MQLPFRLKCCVPCCCFGPYEPEGIAAWILIWDFVVAFLWYFFGIWNASYYGYLYLFITFFYICIIFFVVYDFRRSRKTLSCVQAFNYLRFGITAALYLLCLASFVLIFITSSNPEAEDIYRTANWYIFYFFLSMVVALINTSVGIKMLQVIRAMRSTEMDLGGQDSKKQKLNSSFGVDTRRNLTLIPESYGTSQNVIVKPFKPDIYDV